MKICKWNILFTVALTVLTTYLILDSFVIPETYAKDVNKTEQESEAIIADTQTDTEIQKESDTQENTDPQEDTDTPEDSDTPEVNVTTYRVNDTNVYVADITFSSVKSIKTAFAQDTYGRKITDKTSEMADENDAILAINGDYYGARERGYVIRNGVLYRDTSSDEDVLCIYLDGRMEIVDPNEISAQELLDEGAWQVFSFGPGLLNDGDYLVDQNDEVGRAKASNPRTAIGMIDSNHYVFVVSDGRTEESEGLSLFELAGFMEGLGVQTAYNLDGGGSSTMVYEGGIVNTPVNGRHSSERSVSDIVYI